MRDPWLNDYTVAAAVLREGGLKKSEDGLKILRSGNELHIRVVPVKVKHL